jgi:hypothetical protein
MSERARRFYVDTARGELLPDAVRTRVSILALALSTVVATTCLAQSECLVVVLDAGGREPADGTHCRVAQDRVCTFQLQACVNQAAAGCDAAPLKKKIKAKGSCAGTGRLRVKPQADAAVCGTLVDVRVKTKKKGTREGRCTLKVAAKSTDKPPRKDSDTITLACKPNPGDCPAETTGPTTPRSSTTTTSSPACIQTADCGVAPVGELLNCLAP